MSLSRSTGAWLLSAVCGDSLSGLAGKVRSRPSQVHIPVVDVNETSPVLPLERSW